MDQQVRPLATPPTVQVGRTFVLSVDGERIAVSVRAARGQGYFECYAQPVNGDSLSPMYVTMHESQIRELAEPVAA